MVRLLLVIAFVPMLFGCDGAHRSLANTASESTSTEINETTSLLETNSNSKDVLTLTPAAAAKVLEVGKTTTGPYLRVGVKAGGCQGFIYEMNFDDQANPEKDIFIDSHGVKIVVAKSASLYLHGTSIDFVTTADGRTGFKFNNPSAKIRDFSKSESAEDSASE